MLVGVGCVRAAAVHRADVLRHSQVRQRILVQSQLRDDVLGDVGLDGLLGLALGRLQQVVELLGVELQALEEARRARDKHQQLADHLPEEMGRIRGPLLRL